MTRKIFVLLAAGMLLAAMGGVAAAEAPVLVFAGYDGLTNTEMPAEQPTADPELQYSNTLPWNEREPVETGAMPSEGGSSSDLQCCGGESGPTQGEAGESIVRPGIDDGGA